MPIPANETISAGEKAKALKTMALPIGQGIAGWVAQNRKPDMVNDTRKDPRFAGKFDKASGFQTRSLLCVPMILVTLSLSGGVCDSLPKEFLPPGVNGSPY